MKNIVLVALMLFGMSLPTNARAEMTSDSLSILLWLEFKVNNRGGDIDKNDDIVKPFSLSPVVTGKLYSDGFMEIAFDNINEVVTVSVNMNDSEVDSTEFIPIDGNNSLTFDLDDFGKGMYEVNVVMSDGTVQTATFEY